MAYFGDRVVVFDAFQGPGKYCELRSSGRTKFAVGRRPSMRSLILTREVKCIVGKETQLFDDVSAAATEKNEFVNPLRYELRAWCDARSLTNRDCQSSVLNGADAEHLTVVAEFITILRGG
jgi:hypothetical protein